MTAKQSVKRSLVRQLLLLGALGFIFLAQPAQGQLFDPNNTLILNTLREIATRHQLTLEEQRNQTAQMVRQLRQFYDTYTLLRNDIQFSQSLYRDFKAVENMDLTRSYSVSNFILSGDRLDYWFPSLTGDVTRTAMDVEALLNSSSELQRTYESFALSVNEDGAPDDAAMRRQNALAGQQYFSQALLEYALKCQVLAETYDSLAMELHQQVMDAGNKYTSAERTQLMTEVLKLRELSNSYHGKYLDLSQRAHDKELEMFDEKLHFLRSKGDWDELRNQVNQISRVRYGFFDIVRAPFE